jgi:hypothetical protein
LRLGRKKRKEKKKRRLTLANMKVKMQASFFFYIFLSFFLSLVGGRALGGVSFFSETANQKISILERWSSWSISLV